MDQPTEARDNGLGRRASQREPHLKTRVSWAGINLNIPPVFFHDTLDGVQSETRSFTNSFGRKKGLKDVGLHLRVNAGTVIRNLNHHATVVEVGSDAKLA